MNMLPYITLFLFATFSACGLLGGGDDKVPLEPGPRNYEWRVDSLHSTPDMWVGWANTIWGSAPNDVWLGLTGGYYNLWHYDGKEWTPWPYREGPNGFIGDFYSIFGFAWDDVWMGGKGPGGKGLWHYNGKEWKLAHTYQPEGMGEPNIKDIWGTSSLDLYAVGTVPTGQENPSYTGFILHYDGRRWQEVLMTDFGMQFQRIQKNKEGIYIYGSGPYSTQLLPDSASIYKVNNNHLKELYSKSSREAGTPSMNMLGDKLYVTVENELNEIRSSGFKIILLFDNSEDIFGVNGRNAKDIFILTANKVMHYNGEDTQDLFYLDNQNSTFWSSLILEDDIFFIARDYDTGTNLIYHGTLTEEEKE